MSYRLLALDLDGTLLNSRKEITAATREAVWWAAEQGVYVVLATGRIVGEAAEFAREALLRDHMLTAGGAALPRLSMRRYWKAGRALHGRRAGGRGSAKSARCV